MRLVDAINRQNYQEEYEPVMEPEDGIKGGHGDS